MSQLLEAHKEQFLKAKVNLLKMIGNDSRSLLEATIAAQMTSIIQQRLHRLDDDDREQFCKTLIVTGAAAAQFGAETTLEELSQWLKSLTVKFPAFSQSASIVHGTANAQVAYATNWSADEIAVLTEEVRGQVQYKGDEGKDPIRERIDEHVSDWLDKLFRIYE